MAAVSTTDVLRIRAALSVGVPPAEALSTVTDPALAAPVRAARLGRPLSDIARSHRDQGAGAQGAGPILRALALAEVCGDSGVAAVDMALRARQDALVDEERLAARSAQAAGTAKLLTALPLGAWVLLVAFDRSALGFYATPLGWACAAGSALGTLAGHQWARRLVARAATAAALADPLARQGEPFDRGRAAAASLPVLITLWWLAHPVIAIVVAGAIAALAGRRTPTAAPPCRAVEIIHLLRMALSSGTGVPVAFEHVAQVVGAPLDRRLRAIAARVRNGSRIVDATAGSGLEDVGAVLEITERWGVSAAAPLDLLIDSLHARQRGAAETAAERVQLALVFPTTLLTLPAFVLAVVPPLVWTALAR